MGKTKKLKNPTLRGQRRVSRRIKKLKTKKNKRVSFESFVAPSHEEIMAKIDKKVGTQPPLPKDLPKGAWTKQAVKVLSERYLKKDENGEVIETPDEMCWRVAWDIASAEAVWGKGKREVVKTAREFYQLLVSHEFLPNSPTLMNAGTRNSLQYSACFVLPVDDSLVGIFDAIKYQALIHQTGGGTGFSFSRLRPSGSIVKSSQGVASGPVSFMKIFDAATNEIKQGGRRRGANMGILRVDHPDIMDFIRCKEEGGITNFNISVAITDKFMRAYKKDEDYDMVDPRSGKKVGSLSARKVFDEIAQGAWKTGDPGVIFIDRMNKESSNPVPSVGPVESTNPCGEQPLYPFDACNLGSIFLNYFVIDVDGKRQVDWEKLKKVTRAAARFLDNVIEVNPFPLEQIRKTVFAIRRIGLGVGGWADMLVELGIPYDSEEALKLGEKVMRTIQEEAVFASRDLARQRGPFPLWHESVYKKEKPRRNSTVTTIAPTGSISIIAGSSSGIEPLFAIAYQHIVKDKHLERTLTFVNPMFEKFAKKEGLWSDEIREKVARHGVVRNVEEIPEGVRDVFGTAHEIHHDWHIKMQSAFQKHTENAVSKTINMEKTVSVDEIRGVYLLAWEMGCKGITVFRDGCKDAQVLNLGVKDEKGDTNGIQEPTIERPFKIDGATYKLNTPVGTGFITINEDEVGEPIEIFINVGKAGSDVQAMAEALGRTISISLRFRGFLKPKQRAEEIAHQLAGIGGRRSVGFGSNKILSLPDAVAAAFSWHFGFKINGFQKALETKFQNGELPKNGEPTVEKPEQETKISEPITTQELNETRKQLEEVYKVDMVQAKTAGDICPSCGAGAFVFQEGCAKCLSCGHSEC